MNILTPYEYVHLPNIDKPCLTQIDHANNLMKYVCIAFGGTYRPLPITDPLRHYIPVTKWEYSKTPDL